MKKYCIVLFSFFIALKAFSQDFPQQKVDSKIDHVTVFLSGAQVVRTVTTSLQNGKSEILLRGLTPNLEAQSVTVKGEGDFTILSVKPQMNFLEELKRRDTILNLETERERLLVQLVDELHENSRISEELWQNLMTIWTKSQLLEIIILVGFYHTVSFLTNGLQLIICVLILFQ